MANDPNEEVIEEPGPGPETPEEEEQLRFFIDEEVKADES